MKNGIVRNAYCQKDPEVRKRARAFYEPHNRRLYEHVGVDWGWTV